MKTMPRLACYFLMSALIACARGYAGDSYWVSPAGTSAWNSAKSDSPLGSNACCSLKTACASAKAGDTVFLRGGTYSFSKEYDNIMAPANSGEAGPPIRWIAFKNAPGEAPEIKGTPGMRMFGLVLEGNSYIKIDGITFDSVSDPAAISSASHHVEVLNCTFRNCQHGFIMCEARAKSGGNDFTAYVNHIWVHHNVFYRLAPGGLEKDGTYREGGDAVRVGYPRGTGHGGPGETKGENHHITIENNLIEYAGHACMDTYGTELVVKNNVIHNEPWRPAEIGAKPPRYPPTNYVNSAYENKWSHRCYQSSDDFCRDYTHNLIEGNRIGHAGPNPNNNGAQAMDLASPKNIFRYNSLYNAMESGLLFKYKKEPNGGNGGNGGTDNRVYNNTIFHNGYGYPFYQTCKYPVCPMDLGGISYYTPKTGGNVIKNNIICDNHSFSLYKWDISPQNNAINTITNNFQTSDGDPLFVNPDLSQPTSRTLPDLNLKAGSPAIDGGTNLTVATGSGNQSKTLIVEDALYFQDGTWGSDLARGVTLFPDWIAIGDVDKAVQIASIDYAKNTITLATPMTWSENARIWLYKKSDGTRVLYGKAPDIGAYEYAQK